MNPGCTLYPEVSDRHGDAVSGGTLNSMWMWSGIALPSTNSISFWRHRFAKILPMPRRILGLQHLATVLEEDYDVRLAVPLHVGLTLQSFMAVLLPRGAFLAGDRPVFGAETAEPLGAHRQRRWIGAD